MRSMTGFGKSVKLLTSGTWQVEIHSVNKKGLDIHFFMPKEFLQFDLEMRKKISKEVQRGQITVRIVFEPHSTFVLGEKLKEVEKTQRWMKELASALGYGQEAVTFPFLYEQATKTSIAGSQTSELFSELDEVFSESFLLFMKMKEVEGAFLQQTFLSGLTQIDGLLREVKSQATGSADRYREKLLEKMQAYKEVTLEDRDRVIREAFLLAEKVDLSEEIDRLESHMNQMRSQLCSLEKTTGRMMEFLLQEMWREINTLGSKAEDSALLIGVLKMKGELEKMKEQVLNVE